MTCGRLSVYNTLLQRLAQDLEHMTAAPREFIQKEHAMVGQRHLRRHGQLTAADQPRIRDGVVGRATRAGRDPRRAGAGEAGDAVDACGLKGLSEGHRWQDGGEASGQHQLVHPQTAEKEKV
jgi:hypothetical protein